MAKSVPDVMSTIRFNCGCGFTADNFLEAAVHVSSTGHTLDVLGKVQPLPDTKNKGGK